MGSVNREKADSFAKETGLKDVFEKMRAAGQSYFCVCSYKGSDNIFMSCKGSEVIEGLVNMAHDPNIAALIVEAAAQIVVGAKDVKVINKENEYDSKEEKL